jgi:hypothetical protein
MANHSEAHNVSAIRELVVMKVLMIAGGGDYGITWNTTP